MVHWKFGRKYGCIVIFEEIPTLISKSHNCVHFNHCLSLLHAFYSLRFAQVLVECDLEITCNYFKSFYKNFTIVFTLIIAYPCFMHYDPLSIILPKHSSQKNPPKKISPKKFLTRKSSK